MPTFFHKILRGKISCHKVLEDENHLALLNPNPIKRGHVFVIPKKEIDFLFDMEDAALGELMIFAKKAAKMLKREIPCKKIGMTVIGIETRYAHIHLVPMDQVSDLDFKNAKPAQEEELARLAEKIRNAQG